MPEEEEVDYGDCESCKVAVLGGFVLDICEQGAKFSVRERLGGLSCKSLRRRFERDEITPVELIREVRGRVGPEHRKTIDDIVEAARESGIELKGLEDDAK